MRSQDADGRLGFQYTVDWFSHNIPVWEKHLQPLVGRANLRFLEIGSFEGRSAIWLLTTILTHPTARMDCIECFDGVWEWNSCLVDMAEVERRFDHNMQVTLAAHKVTKIKEGSCEALRKLQFGLYDLIYIDGSHMAVDVLEDAVLSFRLLKLNGILIFDDYQLVSDHELSVPRSAIDAFLYIYRGRYELLHRQAQVIVRKNTEGCTLELGPSATIEVLEVVLQKLDRERFYGFNLEAPQPGNHSAGMILDVIGWVLGRCVAVVAVEILSDGRLLQRVALDVRRPDVAAHFPEVANGDRSGFQTSVNVSNFGEKELLVEALFSDQSREKMGRIRVRSTLPLAAIQ